ncbi:hypothetical protein J6590_095512 [Homalodisca vitripennis]|nr:hypothetical protein J6590_095512 [Homalodisca vitripennis]
MVDTCEMMPNCSQQIATLSFTANSDHDTHDWGSHGVNDIVSYSHVSLLTLTMVLTIGDHMEYMTVIEHRHCEIMPNHSQ